MVTLTKALDPQSPAPYRPLGYEAHVNYEKFITNINDDLYEQLAECIRAASSHGARGIDVYYYDAIVDVEREGLAYLENPEALYNNGLASVRINIIKLVDWESLAKRLEREKLTVMWQYYEDDGDVIDNVTWINAEE